MRAQLSNAPTRYAKCFQDAKDVLHGIPKPTKGWSRAEAVKIIGDLVASNKITAKCGEDLVAWANRQARAARGD